MLAKITILCFAASYGVALLLEVSRLFFRLPVRLVVMLGFGIAGLFAHTLFLWNHAQTEKGAPFSSFHLWFLLAAWLLAAAYVGLAAARPQSSIGIFVLPLVMVLIAAAQFSDPKAVFEPDAAIAAWLRIHGIALLLGTVATALGFVAGLMYLVQSYRLKHKLLPKPGLRLPSLEWLQMVNKQTLYLSAILVAVGVFAGVVSNILHPAGVIRWTDPLILSSGGLLAWLFAATLFELFYKPAQQGRKVAYLTIANFVFLAAVLFILLFGNSQHAPTTQACSPLRSPLRFAALPLASPLARQLACLSLEYRA